MQYIVTAYAFTIAGVSITFGFGAFLFALVGLGEIKHDLKKINNLAKVKGTRSETLIVLDDFVLTHGRVIKLSNFFFKKSVHKHLSQISFQVFL